MNIDHIAELQDWECAECGMPLEDRDGFISEQDGDEFVVCEPCAEVGIRLQAGILIAGAEQMLGIVEITTRQLQDEEQS
jgi:hypothetical protein